jgi:hypothetical protein
VNHPIRSAGTWLGADTVPLRYRGVTPIATCHWQWIANVLSADGHGDYWDQLGLAWGCRWHGSGVLFGSMDWPLPLRQAFGAVVAIRAFSNANEARQEELSLSARGLPFIAEVDQFFLGPEGRKNGHVVHAVLVTERTQFHARIVDSWTGPDVMLMDVADYELMRESECEGRVETYKLYVILRGPTRDPGPEELLGIVRQHLQSHQQESQRALRRYTDAMRDSDSRIDVCRVAGERYQTARLFRYLAAAGVTGMEDLHQRLAELSDDWYLLHLLASHERGMEPRARTRQLRLLNLLGQREAAVVKAVLA